MKKLICGLLTAMILLSCIMPVIAEDEWKPLTIDCTTALFSNQSAKEIFDFPGVRALITITMWMDLVRNGYDAADLYDCYANLGYVGLSEQIIYLGMWKDDWAVIIQYIPQTDEAIYKEFTVKSASYGEKIVSTSLKSICGNNLLKNELDVLNQAFQLIMDNYG